MPVLAVFQQASAWTAINVIWSEEGPHDSLHMPFARRSLRGALSSCVPMLPLGGWHQLDNTLIIKFTMKNVFCSTGRNEIKPCFGFSLFELLVPPRLYSYCIDTAGFCHLLLSHLLLYKLSGKFKILKWLHFAKVLRNLSRNSPATEEEKKGWMLTVAAMYF